MERLNALPVEEVARRLGMEVGRHKALCFMHDDHHPSLSFNVRKNIYYCFVCQKGGGPIRLVQDREGLRLSSVRTWVSSSLVLLSCPMSSPSPIIPGIHM